MGGSDDRFFIFMERGEAEPSCTGPWKPAKIRWVENMLRERGYEPVGPVTWDEAYRIITDVVAGVSAG